MSDENRPSTDPASTPPEDSLEERIRKAFAIHARNQGADNDLAKAMRGEVHAPENGPETETIRIQMREQITREVYEAQRAFDRWSKIMGWVFAFGIIFSIVYMATAVRFIGLRVREPAYVYTSDVYESVKRNLCPGEPLTYVLTTTIKSAPAHVAISYSIRNSDTFTNVKNGPVTTVGGGLIYIPSDIGRVRRSVVVVTDTLKGLPPANYTYLRIATEGDSVQQYHAVPFTIRGDCPATGR